MEAPVNENETGQGRGGGPWRRRALPRLETSSATDAEATATARSIARTLPIPSPPRRLATPSPSGARTSAFSKQGRLPFPQRAPLGARSAPTHLRKTKYGPGDEDGAGSGREENLMQNNNVSKLELCAGQAPTRRGANRPSLRQALATVDAAPDYEDRVGRQRVQSAETALPDLDVKENRGRLAARNDPSRTIGETSSPSSSLRSSGRPLSRFRTIRSPRSLDLSHRPTRRRPLLAENAEPPAHCAAAPGQRCRSFTSVSQVPPRTEEYFLQDHADNTVEPRRASDSDSHASRASIEELTLELGSDYDEDDDDGFNGDDEMENFYGDTNQEHADADCVETSLPPSSSSSSSNVDPTSPKARCYSRASAISCPSPLHYSGRNRGISQVDDFQTMMARDDIASTLETRARRRSNDETKSGVSRRNTVLPSPKHLLAPQPSRAFAAESDDTHVRSISPTESANIGARLAGCNPIANIRRKRFHTPPIRAINAQNIGEGLLPHVPFALDDNPIEDPSISTAVGATSSSTLPARLDDETDEIEGADSGKISLEAASPGKITPRPPAGAPPDVAPPSHRATMPARPSSVQENLIQNKTSHDGSSAHPVKTNLEHAISRRIDGPPSADEELSHSIQNIFVERSGTERSSSRGAFKPEGGIFRQPTFVYRRSAASASSSCSSFSSPSHAQPGKLPARRSTSEALSPRRSPVPLSPRQRSPHRESDHRFSRRISSSVSATLSYSSSRNHSPSMSSNSPVSFCKAPRVIREPEREEGSHACAGPEVLGPSSLSSRSPTAGANPASQIPSPAPSPTAAYRPGPLEPISRRKHVALEARPEPLKAHDNDAEHMPQPPPLREMHRLLRLEAATNKNRPAARHRHRSSDFAQRSATLDAAFDIKRSSTPAQHGDEGRRTPTMRRDGATCGKKELPIIGTLSSISGLRRAVSAEESTWKGHGRTDPSIAFANCE